MSSGFTPKIQQLLIFGMEKGAFSYDSQTIFTNKKYFDAVKFLLDAHLIVHVCAICHGPMKEDQDYFCSKQDIYHRNPVRVKIKSFTLNLSGYSLAYLLPKDKNGKKEPEK